MDLILAPGARSGTYLVTSDDSSYHIEFRPETDVVLGDLLRRLPAVLVGQPDPSHLLVPTELLHAIGTRLWQAILPDTAPSDARDQLRHALTDTTTTLRLTLPTSLEVLPWELLCNPERPDD